MATLKDLFHAITWLKIQKLKEFIRTSFLISVHQVPLRVHHGGAALTGVPYEDKSHKVYISSRMCCLLSVSCWFSLPSLTIFQLLRKNLRLFFFFFFNGHSNSFQFFSAVFLISPLTQCFPAFFTS